MRMLKVLGAPDHAFRELQMKELVRDLIKGANSQEKRWQARIEFRDPLRIVITL
jgi:hypothetical protein